MRRWMLRYPRGIEAGGGPIAKMDNFKDAAKPPRSKTNIDLEDGINLGNKKLR